MSGSLASSDVAKTKMIVTPETFLVLHDLLNHTQFPVGPPHSHCPLVQSLWTLDSELWTLYFEREGILKGPTPMPEEIGCAAPSKKMTAEMVQFVHRPEPFMVLPNALKSPPKPYYHLLIIEQEIELKIGTTWAQRACLRLHCALSPVPHLSTDTRETLWFPWYT